MVSSFLPYPLYSGGHIRLYNLIKELSKKHEIILVCEKRDWQTKDDVSEVEKFCSVITVPRKRQWSLGNILKTGFSKNPFLVVGHTNGLMKKEIIKILSKEKFDLIHVETFYVMQNLPKTNLPIVLADHNIEYLVYKRFANQASLFLKLFFYLDVLKMKFIEEDYWKKATRVVAVSEDEKRLMNGNDIVVIPNGVNVTKFKVESLKLKEGNKERRLLFIGDFKWMQNRDSIDWILKEIWPEIKAKIQNSNIKLNLKMWIVGRNIPDSIKKLANGSLDVIFEENAEDTVDIFNKSFLLLAPIRVGGGTSYKILEAMASGIPVITTRLGIEGIKAKEDEEVIIANNTEDFANRALEVLKDENLYEKLSKKGRSLIVEEYDWENISKKLEETYLSILK